MAIDFLADVFDVRREKIIRIEHGVPDFEIVQKKLPPIPLNWENRTIILTFGLIGRSKGIETAIKSLPAIISKHPEVMYVILGKTHPHVLHYAGEEYREFLQELVTNLNLSNNVLFINEYIDESTLMAYLRRADLYITPYLNKSQITSGTLSYALGGGCAILSTPYWHAEELLADERGILFDFGSYTQLASSINRLLNHPDLLQQLKDKAYKYGLTITWPKIGRQYLDLFSEILTRNEFYLSLKSEDLKIKYPTFDISHLKRLTDETGLLQHARTSIPYFKAGYCLDDNSRAIIVVLAAWIRKNDQVYLDLLDKYLAYTVYMQQPDGCFRNYMTYEHTLLDDTSDDALGRLVWAIGYLIRFAPGSSVLQLGLEMFNPALTKICKLSYSRGYANCILGIYHYLKRFPDQEKFIKLTSQLSDMLCEKYELHKKKNWHWFEDTLTYDNGLLPAALYRSYEITGNTKYLQVAEESRIFLESKCFREDWLSLVGNQKWLRLDQDYELFAQQPVDAMAMIVLYESAFEATGNKQFIEKLKKSFNWFFGDNDLNISLVDPESNGCSDGIEPLNINLNQGAESNIAYLLSRLIAEPYLNESISLK